MMSRSAPASSRTFGSSEEPASALYAGTVRHRRFEPLNHEFRYRLFMTYLDLNELPELFDGRWLWSARRPAPAWFRRADYLGDPGMPLDHAVRQRVREELGREPEGPIRMLTHLRFFGFVFNPVTFYFCFSRDGISLEAVVAEITNTPWNERHSYVLDAPSNQVGDGDYRFRFNKDFHVSPFLSMDYRYDWRVSLHPEGLTIHMENLQAEKPHLDATLTLRKRPFTGPHLARALAQHPFMTAKVFLAIYWQAFRLWRKRCPFFSHPHSSADLSTAPQVRASAQKD